METPYNYAEINSRGWFVWSDHRLTQRYVDLEETQKIPHTAERQQAIRHEMACIAFELVSRELDERRREIELQQMEDAYALPPFAVEGEENGDSES